MLSVYNIPFQPSTLRPSSRSIERRAEWSPVIETRLRRNSTSAVLKHGGSVCWVDDASRKHRRYLEKILTQLLVAHTMTLRLRDKTLYFLSEGQLFFLSTVRNQPLLPVPFRNPNRQGYEWKPCLRISWFWGWRLRLHKLR